MKCTRIEEKAVVCRRQGNFAQQHSGETRIQSMTEHSLMK